MTTTWAEVWEVLAQVRAMNDKAGRNMKSDDDRKALGVALTMVIWAAEDARQATRIFGDTYVTEGLEHLEEALAEYNRQRECWLGTKEVSDG